jgi:defect-in-organelle-trafficking protein DotD
MKIKRILLFVVFASLLTACATGTYYKKPPYNAPSDDASIKLAEAANSVSDSMLKMARIEKVVTPPGADNLKTIPNTHNLQTRASVDWSGPIGELTGRIAHAAHFHLRVLGQAPAVPVLISLDVNDQSLAEILRNIDYQAGQKASIHVYPNSQVIELRYAKIYS